jgi:hypothetical protein
MLSNKISANHNILTLIKVQVVYIMPTLLHIYHTIATVKIQPLMNKLKGH